MDSSLASPSADQLARPNPKAAGPVDVAIGRAIRARRTATGMSQQKLGKAMNVTFQQVQKYEAGTNRLSIAGAAKIAGALRCTVADLCRDAGL